MDLLKVNAEIKEMNKTDLFNSGSASAIDALAKGENDASELLITARKASEMINGYINTVNEAVFDEIYIKGASNPIEVYGSKIELGSTGDRLDYNQDPIYAMMQKELTQRADLLKLAHKSDNVIIDHDGVEVPKVGLKSASKEILRVKL